MKRPDQRSGDSTLPNRWIWGLAVTGVVAFAALLRAPIAGIPFERDEGEYAYIAQRWLQGDIPYLKTFDQKPPGVFVIYVLIERFMGTSPQAIHWATQGYTLLTLGVIGYIGVQFFSPPAGLLAALIAAVMTADATVLGQASNTEIFLLLPATVTLLIVLMMIRKPTATKAFLAGLFLAFCVLIKQVAIVYALPVLFLMALLPRRYVWLSASGAGCIVGLLPCLYWPMHGAWQNFLDCVIGYNMDYATLGRFWPALHTVVWPHILSFWPVYGVAGLSFRHLRGRNKEHLSSASRMVWKMLWGWFLFSLWGICIGGFIRMHYVMQVIPSASLLAGWELADWRISRYWRTRRLAFAIGVAGLIGYPLMMNLWYLSPGSAAIKSRRLYGENPFPESQEVGDFIRAETQPGDRVFIFGSEPQILYFAERASASRYIFMYPAILPTRTALTRQMEIWRELSTPPFPQLIVTVFDAYSFMARRQTPAFIFEQLGAWLPKHYEVVGLVPATDGILAFNGNPAPLVTGSPAQKAWAAGTSWYPPNGKFAMAIWKWRS